MKTSFKVDREMFLAAANVVAPYITAGGELSAYKCIFISSDGSRFKVCGTDSYGFARVGPLDLQGIISPFSYFGIDFRRLIGYLTNCQNPTVEFSLDLDSGLCRVSSDGFVKLRIVNAPELCLDDLEKAVEESLSDEPLKVDMSSLSSKLSKASGFVATEQTKECFVGLYLKDDSVYSSDGYFGYFSKIPSCGDGFPGLIVAKSFADSFVSSSREGDILISWQDNRVSMTKGPVLLSCLRMHGDYPQTVIDEVLAVADKEEPDFIFKAQELSNFLGRIREFIRGVPGGGSAADKTGTVTSITLTPKREEGKFDVCVTALDTEESIHDSVSGQTKAGKEYPTLAISANEFIKVISCIADSEDISAWLCKNDRVVVIKDEASQIFWMTMMSTNR